MPMRSIDRRSSRRVASRSDGSRFDSGSSRSRRRGSGASARASATRCCMPPEISLTRRGSSPGRRTSASTSATRAAHPLRRPAARLEPEGDVLADREVREERVVLEHHAEVAALGRHAGHLLAVHQDAAGVGDLEPGQAAQERRLAAAARAEERHDRAALDLEREVAQHLALAEPLGEILDPQKSRGQSKISHQRLLPRIVGAGLRARPSCGGQGRPPLRVRERLPPVLSSWRSAAPHFPVPARHPARRLARRELAVVDRGAQLGERPPRPLGQLGRRQVGAHRQLEGVARRQLLRLAPADELDVGARRRRRAARRAPGRPRR